MSVKSNDWNWLELSGLYMTWVPALPYSMAAHSKTVRLDTKTHAVPLEAGFTDDPRIVGLPHNQIVFRQFCSIRWIRLLTHQSRQMSVNSTRREREVSLDVIRFG